MVAEVGNINRVDAINTLGVVEKNSIAYIETVFASLRSGVVVVPLRSEDDRPRIDAIGVQDIVSPSNHGGWVKQSLVLPTNDDTVAHISFTSGTEGAPKGVFISRKALNDSVSRVQMLMQMDASVKEYIGVPVYHSFGYGRCRHVASVGGDFYIPATGFDPREFSTMLSQGEVNALSLVPSLLRLLFDTPSLLGEVCHQLKWLEIGSQSMTKEEKVAVKTLFPNANIVQHYGLTEASRTTLLPIHHTDESFLDSVGKAYGDIELAINDAGCICIKGAHLASRIVVDGEIVPVVNCDGWFETTDLGRLQDGYLYFLGRADNVVNCGGQKLSTEKLASAMAEILESEIAVSRIAHPLYGEGFLISYVNDEKFGEIRSAALACLATLGITAKNALCYQQIDKIPRTHTGKIQYKVLSSLYEKAQHEQSIASVEKGKSGDIMHQFASLVGLRLKDININDSVSDIGIDSLQSVQLSIAIERAFGYLPTNWRTMSIKALAQMPPRPREHQTSVVTTRQKTNKKAPPLWDGSSDMNPSDISFWGLLKEDFTTHDRDIFSQGLFALFVNRFGNWRMGIRLALLRFPMTLVYRVLRKMTQIFCGIKLDYTVHVGRRVKLEHFGGMILGARRIGDDTVIRQNTTLGIRDMSDLSAKPTIEQGVNIGAGAVIVGDITVGRYSIIGPNSVVTEDLPPFSVVSVGALVVTTHSQYES
jgi:acyl-CoA synthetase (AMP-forming)/AMP-acid ligase II/serine acetyltransferase